ncbi:Hypothetical protein SRM_00004 [Salinibacter ruber M8]|uniref:Uncharacterized protein n=1 Tax=Salinibacter ruber (strain M8) TaxID=761659 RepID=D5H4H0_SALRM|nr:Hypothetical protein SRM_00004 [Salinibacter ruber M8]
MSYRGNNPNVEMRAFSKIESASRYRSSAADEASGAALRILALA